MAAQNTLSIPEDVWTLVTATDVTALRIQNIGVKSIKIQATSGTTAPTNDLGALILGPKETIAADTLLSALFPGVTGANRVWVLAHPAGAVSFSHA